MTEIKSRNVLFSYDVKGEWNLNLQLIKGVKHNFIVDSGLGSQSIKPLIEFLEGDTKPIILINTHYHWDHVWGNHLLKNSMIISHRICREILDECWENDLERFADYAQGDNRRSLPNLVFDQELYFPEDQVRLIFTPGHTEDSISVMDELDKVLNAGDNIGDTMDEIIPSLACEKALYLDTILKYRVLDFDVCLSGHNDILNKDIIDVILARL